MNRLILNQQYKILRILSENSFGKLYLTENIKTKEKYVIKEINVEKLNDENKKLISKDGAMLPNLNHPNIIKYNDFYFPNSCAYIIMEYLEGSDLEKKIIKNKETKTLFSEKQVFKWFSQICNAIKYIDEKKIIHRNIKPSNIFLTEDNNIKIGDFAIEKIDTLKSKIENNEFYFSELFDIGLTLFEITDLKNNNEKGSIIKVQNLLSNLQLRDSHYSEDLFNIIKASLIYQPNKRLKIIENLQINERIKKSLLFDSDSIISNHMKNSISNYSNTTCDSIISDSNNLTKSISIFDDEEEKFRLCKYIGDYKNKKREGKGIQYYKTRDKYDGEWKNNKKEGKGILYYCNGDKYDGEWKNNKKEGKGIFYFKNGDKYDGEWKNDKSLMTGYLKKYSKNGDVYEGQILNGKKEGKGIKTYFNGDKYDGEWKNNKKEGKGILYYNNGDKYDGEWKNDLREGKGTYIYANGQRYDGVWKNNKKEGKGTFYYNNGSKYDGEWKNNNKEGYGKMFYNNGNIYEGQWKNDLIEGIGA